jgi:foldase protein PrsA
MRRQSVILFAASCILGLAANAKQLPTDVAATVNGQPIPEKLVQSFLANDQEAVGAYPNNDEGHKKLSELRQAIINELIDRVLIAQEVKKRGISPTEQEIDGRERNMILYTGDDTRYEEFVRQNHFTRAEYREFVLKTAANGEALRKDLTKDIQISPKEIQDYFDAHHAEVYFQWPERVTGAHILFNTQRGVLEAQLKHDRPNLSGNDLEKAIVDLAKQRERLAEQVRNEAANGADFAALAKKYSDDGGTKNNGGNLGTFARGTHPMALDDAFFKLKPGEIAPVVKTEFGFHVIKSLSYEPARPKTLEESTAEIKSRLFQAKAAQRLRDWLKQAKARSTIAIRSSVAK